MIAVIDFCKDALGEIYVVVAVAAPFECFIRCCMFAVFSLYFAAL